MHITAMGDQVSTDANHPTSEAPIQLDPLTAPACLAHGAHPVDYTGDAPAHKMHWTYKDLDFK